MEEEKAREQGQSVVEVALVLPLLLMILVGMVEIGWAMRAHLTVTTAAREGARFGSRRVFTYNEIQEVVYVAMLALNPQFDGPDANATIIITKVHIDAEGNWSIDGGAPYVTGTLPVASRVPASTFQELADDNVVFNDAHTAMESENNVVVVEVFFNHDLLLGTRMGAQTVGLGPLPLYGRSINRIGVSRYE
jgi:hypothetical protein